MAALLMTAEDEYRKSGKSSHQEDDGFCFHGAGEMGFTQDGLGKYPGVLRGFQNLFAIPVSEPDNGWRR